MNQTSHYVMQITTIAQLIKKRCLQHMVCWGISGKVFSCKIELFVFNQKMPAYHCSKSTKGRTVACCVQNALKIKQIAVDQNERGISWEITRVWGRFW